MARPRKPDSERWRGTTISISGGELEQLKALAFELAARSEGAWKPSLSAAVRYLLKREMDQRRTQ